MKILVITSVFPNSKQPALGIFVRERIFQLTSHHEIMVVAPVPWFPLISYIKKDYRVNVPYREMQDGIEVFHPRFFNIPKFFKFIDGIFFFLSSCLTVRKLRKDFNFDLIDSHFVYPDGLGAVLLGKVFKTPVSITVRGTIRKLSKYAFIKPQITYALKRSAKIFAVCNDLKMAASGLDIPEDDISVIPNGVDINKFKPINRENIRKELGLPQNKKIIISVGGLVERKGFHRIITILPFIKETFPEIMYVIVGGQSVEGNYEPVLKKLVKDLGLSDIVRFSGPQPHKQLYKWLNASDVFCLATSNEGWANVFLEAMACGLPVVTTLVGGNEEVVVSEDYGLLFKLDDEKEMLRSLITALEKKWDREKIIAFARSNTWEERAIHLSQELNNIMVEDNVRLSDKVGIP
jgi:glycosyltransferase involved in cell wall biosynthesis